MRTRRLRPAVMAVALVFGLALLFVGIGLLKGQKWTWFVQLAFSLLNLFSFPFGTILHGFILYFFFQPPTRQFFKV